MKSVVACAILVLGLHGLPDSAAADRISVYQPSGGGLTDDCNLEINDISHRLNIVHESTGGSTGSEFRLVFDWGSGSGTILAGSSPFADPPYFWTNGVTLNYGTCLTGDFYVGEIVIAGETNVECEAFLHVRRAFGNSNVLSADCSGVPQVAMGGTLTINGNDSCPCHDIVPTGVSTWGKIKSAFASGDDGF